MIEYTEEKLIDTPSGVKRKNWSDFVDNLLKNTEAVSAMIEYGKRQLGLKRTTLRANPENARAIHVYKKCGLREYHRTEEHVFMETKHRSFIKYVEVN